MNPMRGVLSDCAQSVAITKSQLQNGKLTVVQMHNYNRNKLLYEHDKSKKYDLINLSPKIQTFDNILDYALTSLAYISCSEEHTICFKGLLNFYIDKDETCEHLKFNDSCFKYFRSPRISESKIIEFLQRYPEALAGIKLSLSNKKNKEYVECTVTDFNQTKPALFSLALIILAQSISTQDEWQALKNDWRHAMLLAHIGDDELYNCLMNDNKIDFHYFKNKWEKSAKEFKIATKQFYLY
jgi:hypothetical protein